MFDQEYCSPLSSDNCLEMYIVKNISQKFELELVSMREKTERRAFSNRPFRGRKLGCYLWVKRVKTF